LDDYCFLPYIFGSGQLRGEHVLTAIVRFDQTIGRSIHHSTVRNPPFAVTFNESIFLGYYAHPRCQTRPVL
jgi:hypothetical protein